jgi:hypothetical protein
MNDETANPTNRQLPVPERGLLVVGPDDPLAPPRRGRDPEPLLSFFHNLIDPGVNYWQADYLVGRDVRRYVDEHPDAPADRIDSFRRVRESEYQKPPSWRIVAELVDRQVSDVLYRLKTLELRNASDESHQLEKRELEDRLAAWSACLRPRLMPPATEEIPDRERRLATLADRLKERRSEWGQRGLLPPEWKPLGYQGRFRAHESAAELLREQADRLEAGEPIEIVLGGESPELRTLWSELRRRGAGEA